MYYNNNVYSTQTHGHITQPKKQHNTHWSPLSALFDLSLRKENCFVCLLLIVYTFWIFCITYILPIQKYQ